MRSGPREEPAWFARAMAREAHEDVTSSSGTTIRVRSWGPVGAPGLVLIHGGAAHARWWDHIAPLLCDGRRVAAVDLSGHGDSGRLERYTLDQWADDVRAATAVSGMAERPTLIGHSMGGMVALHAAARFPDTLARVIAVDTPLDVVTPEDAAARERVAFGPQRRYATEQDALARFRLIPAQPGVLPYVLEHVARHSVRPVEGGWSWKFDRAVFNRDPLDLEPLARLRCPTTLIGAQRGLLTPQMATLVRDVAGRPAPLVEIPDAGHHVLLDRPLCLVSALRAVLAA